MSEFAKTYGRDGLMIIGAVRYCLGRRTYIVSDCADWIIANWAEWPDSVKSIIKRDVEEEFRRDAENPEWNVLGDDCDSEQWMIVRRLWMDENDPAR